MIRQPQKAFRAGSRLNPLHCGKSCVSASDFRKWNYSILVLTLNIKTIISNSLAPSHRILK